MKTLLKDPAISDDEALEIRDHFYSLAELMFEQWQKEQEKKKLQNIEH